MATINIVVPQLAEKTFSGGIYCVLRHAIGLRSLGHQVNVVPLLPSPRPRWIEGDFGTLPDGSAKTNRRRIARELGALLHFPGMRRSGMKSREIKQRLTNAIGFHIPRAFSPLLQRAIQMVYVAEHMPPADITMATSFESALAVCVSGVGRKFYFAQHYEPYFAMDYPQPRLAEMEARASYHLGLQVIANSSWLKNQLVQTEGLDKVLLCPNAIDLDVFSGQPKTADQRANEVCFISYGGRNATWKGFADMAHAMNLARKQSGDIKIRWQVYGAALLPPDNDVATYEPLGFLQQPALAQAYRNADALLSASWYESFPLFPLEAMACGLPVITTQPGTEEFAIPGLTAEVVPAKNPQQLAASILKLATEVEYRKSLAVRGQQEARRFSWGAATNAMNDILKTAC